MNVSIFEISGAAPSHVVIGRTCPLNTRALVRAATLTVAAFCACSEDGGAVRRVTLHYDDDAGSVDSLASRVIAIHDDLLDANAATYAYARLSRRIGATLGNGVTHSHRLGGGYAGLDRFGRVSDLHYRDAHSDNVTLRRDQYGYDRAGNRLYDRVTQRRPNVANQTWDNVRSWLYQYDGLQRLVDAHMGQLNSTNTAVIDPDNGTVPLRRKMTWNLDNLSNWSGGTVANGSFIRSDDTDNDPAWEVESKIHHQVDAFNRITEVDLNGNLNADTVYDIAGNLVFDQDYFYQYDAWGRLVQVNRMLGMTAADFDGEGRLLGSAAGHVGDLVAHYSYDGLGRLIVKSVLTAPGSSTKQHQHHYYDGVRRVQEQFHTESSGGGGTWTTRREYLHGTDYVDEYVLQVHNPACDGGGGGGDTTGHCGPDSAQVVYMLQDANYNVVATLDGGASTGCGGGCGSGGCGDGGGSGCGGGGDGSGGGGANEIGVYEQYTHEPYGQLAALDKFITTPPQNPVGHQGLFYDHYCATSPSAPCLQVAHKGLYQNRNRFYHPKLGRFIQSDYRDTGITWLSTDQRDKQGRAAAQILNSAGAPYIDGMNHFVYVRANPVILSDPLGASAWSKMYGIAGGPYYMGPAAVGYAAGLAWARIWGGFGPDSTAGMAGMWLDRFGPDYLEGDVGGLAKWMVRDVIPEVYEDLMGLAADALISGLPGKWGLYASFASSIVSREYNHLTSRVTATVRGYVQWAAGITAFAGFYAGIMEAVIWSTEKDMTGDDPDVSDW